MCDFHIRVAGDDLVFCAAHFLVASDGACERLHGHSYRLAAEIRGPLDQNQCVADFVAVRGALKAIVAELDHRTLLPSQHAVLRVVAREGGIEASAPGRRWIFPEKDCLLLPLANTTTELLARYVGERLLASPVFPQGGGGYLLRIEVGEGAGSSAAFEMNS
jgi:6-pyruvoyltetrahydropterin/6-carboxytetrahydropterin synthase